MEPIQLSEDLRVSDYDANQYAIEARTVAQTGKNAGKETWTPIAYCGSVKSLPGVARRVYAGYFAEIERKAAQERFDAVGFCDELAKLPPKKGKAK